MPNTNYRMGAHLEREAKKVLEDQGYCVMRSAGSHGLFDLVAFDWRIIRLIQIKKNRKLTATEIQAIEAIPVPSNTRKESWTKVPGTYGKFEIEVIK